MTVMTTVAKRLVADVFDRHAEPYRARVETMTERGQALSRGKLLRWLAAKAGEWVLDLGCGPGTLTRPLALAVGPMGMVTAVDLAPAMLARVRKIGPNVCPMHMDVERLDFPDAEFDAVAAGFVFQFCPDLDRALHEAHRVLRLDGRLVATFPAERGRLSAPAFDGIRELLPPEPDEMVLAVRATLDTRSRLADERMVGEAVSAAGFRWKKIARVDEPIAYRSPADLLEAMQGWWDWAWRMDNLSLAKRALTEELVLDGLQSRYGDGPVEVPAAVHVLYARA